MTAATSTPRRGRPPPGLGRRRPVLQLRRPLAAAALHVLGVLLYLILPILVMIAFSFNDPPGGSTSSGASSRWRPG